MNDVRCRDANLPFENSTRRAAGTGETRIIRNIILRWFIILAERSQIH